MKKLMVLVLILSLSLAGCASAEAGAVSSGVAGTEPNVEETKDVGCDVSSPEETSANSGDSGDVNDSSEANEANDVTESSDSDDLNKVVTIQLGSIKMPVEQMDQESSKALLEKLSHPDEEAVVYGVKQGDKYFAVCLHYENGDKKVFHFYHIAGKWYMESPDGTMYANADFITDYVGGDFADMEEAVEGSPLILIDDDWLAWDEKFDEHDLNFDFYSEVKDSIERGSSEEEAIRVTKESLKNHQILIGYAKDMGHAVTDERIEVSLQDMAKALKSAKGADPEKIDSYLSKSWESTGDSLAVDSLWQSMSDSWRNGNDAILGTECDTFDDYWAQFLQKVVYPSADEDELAEIDAQLSDAEARYHELEE